MVIRFPIFTLMKLIYFGNSTHFIGRTSPFLALHRKPQNVKFQYVKWVVLRTCYARKRKIYSSFTIPTYLSLMIQPQKN